MAEGNVEQMIEGRCEMRRLMNYRDAFGLNEQERARYARLCEADAALVMRLTGTDRLALLSA